MTALAREHGAPFTHKQVLVVFSGLVLAMLLAALDSTIVSTALPTIVGELGGLNHLAWVVTAYLLAQTVVTPLYGKLGDLYGRKGVMQGAIVLFLAGSMLCGASQNMTQLIIYRAVRVRHAIDYAGASLLAAALSAIVLVADLGGATYAWTSTPMIVLGVVAVVSTLGFILVERRAAEPVLPLRLFRNHAFWVTSTVGFVVGFALFGSMTYLPLFLQVAKGVTPTASGLQMLPMMGGMLVTSIVSGQVISRTGRYKIFPVVGTAVMTLGLFLLSRMTPATSTLVASGIMLVMGLGLGMVMQVLVIAVQNAVDYSDLGVATSGATLFRLIGGSVGTAVLGAIFAARLGGELQRLLPVGATGAPAPGAAITTEALAALEPSMRAIYSQAFALSLSTAFLVATGVAVVGFLLATLMPELPLRTTLAATTGDRGSVAGEAFAMPGMADSLAELRRGLASLANRDARRTYMKQIVDDAGVDLTPLAAWLLVRIESDPGVNVATVHGLDSSVVADATRELVAGGLVRHDDSEEHRGDGGSHGSPRRFSVTRAGCDVLAGIVAVRRAHLAAASAEWHTGEHDAAALRDIERDLVPDPEPPTGRRQ